MSKVAWALVTTFGPLVLIPLWQIQASGPGVPSVNVFGELISLRDAIQLVLKLSFSIFVFWLLSFFFDWVTRKEKSYRSAIALLLFWILMALLLRPSIDININIF